MASTDDIMEALRKMELKADANARDLKNQLTKKIENLERKVDSAKNEANERKKSVTERNSTISTTD